MTIAGDFPGVAAVTGSVRVTLGGRELPAANVLYAGDLPSGDLPLVLTIGGNSSPSGDYLTVN